MHGLMITRKVKFMEPFLASKKDTLLLPSIRKYTINLKWKRFVRLNPIVIFLVFLGVSACDDDPKDQVLKIASGSLGIPGTAIPDATEAQLETFARGEAIALRRWRPDEGLGPLINVTFCGACHEKPVFGGAAGHYRDFYIYGETFGGGGFSPLGPRSGVLTTFVLDSEAAAAEASGEPIAARDREDPHPKITKRETEPEANLSAARNPIPFFGIGLLAQISEDAILAHADPDDQDGDGISGRPNYDQGYVGRFGVKAQTVSIENFIRGPLFNHLGITTNPLPTELQAILPIPSVAMERDDSEEDHPELDELGAPLQVGVIRLDSHSLAQAAAPSSPLTDTDAAPDPEMSATELFDLVSWAMLLAAPAPSPMNANAELGQGTFEAIGCAACHIPSLPSPQGLVPAYSDLLLHDMGEDLADGLVMGLASGSEFRTAPLWGILATGPYLHDGRADTLEDAILAHGGEAQASKEAFENLSSTEQEALLAFLHTLGGAEVYTEGLLPPHLEPPRFGELGGPSRQMNDAEHSQWLRGRALYDRDMGYRDGLGPVLNGDSCRGCHFEPIFGGGGPIGVSAVRFGYQDEEGMLIQPEGPNLIRRFASPKAWPPHSGGEAIFEVRQALPTFGLDELYQIPEELLIARADPEDENGDGIRGIARRLANGSLGRYGWRAQLPSPREFVADALGMELGLTISADLGLMAAITSDDDVHSDPEFDTERFEDLAFFVGQIAPPPMGQYAGDQPLAPIGDNEAWLASEGATYFEAIGCAQCHPSDTYHGILSRPAFTDLLLHDVQDADFKGVTGSDIDPKLFRTPPMWALAGTAPYWHDGRAPNIEAAIFSHHGEAKASREAYQALSTNEQEALLSFLRGL